MSHFLTKKGVSTNSQLFMFHDVMYKDECMSNTNKEATIISTHTLKYQSSQNMIVYDKYPHFKVMERNSFETSVI